MSSLPDLATLTAGCEAEQLHLSGAIQPHGALIVIAGNGEVTHVSANLAAHTGIDARQVLADGHLDALPSLAATLTDLSGATPPGSRRLLSGICSGPAGERDAWLIRSESGHLLELLPARTAPPLPIHRLQLPLLYAPGSREELLVHHQALVDGVQEATGFDRVMLYRFHEDFSGEVIAETARGGIGSYLGLRFPASDIPAIARRLYLINPWRSIPDIHAPPSPLLGAPPPDLTHSLLRSVSPVHLRYLAHMGVAASFSLPIRIGTQLWGLIACHHGAPRIPDPDACEAASSLARAHALGLATWLAQHRMQRLDAAGRRVDLILGTLAAHDSLLDGLAAQPAILLDLMDADGFAVAVSDEFIAGGTVPDSDTLADLDAGFLADPEAVRLCDEAGMQFPALAARLAPIAGIAALKVPYRPAGGSGGGTPRCWLRLYWFRIEEAREVAWAGNPDKPQAEDTAIPTLAPRRSFERWVEIRRGVSRPWSNESRMHCACLRSALLHRM